MGQEQRQWQWRWTGEYKGIYIFEIEDICLGIEEFEEVQEKILETGKNCN